MKRTITAVATLAVSVVLVVAGLYCLRKMYPHTTPIGSGFDLADFFMLALGVMTVAGIAGVVRGAGDLLKGRD